MSYQMELDRQYRNGREEGIKEGMEKGSELATENINKLMLNFISNFQLSA